MKLLSGLAVGVAAVVLTGTTFLLSAVPQQDASCGTAAAVQDQTVAGYGGDQLVNAAAVMNAATALGLDSHAQLLGVMAAMGESGLRNLTYGDYETNGVTNPDGSRTTSIGLFQQQDSWGTRDERLDPTTAATLFYERLIRVDGWETMTPTLAIHAVQRNANPRHYAPFQDEAEDVVDALSASCTVAAGEWIVPARGTVTDTFGTCAKDRPGGACHKGTDLANGGCGAPIWAAAAGVVTQAGFHPDRGYTVWIDHGGGIKTGYFHMEAGSLRVTEDAVVTAGTQLGTMGKTGFSKGCHLHYQVERDGTPIDPEPFMRTVGAPLPHGAS